MLFLILPSFRIHVLTSIRLEKSPLWSNMFISRMVFKIAIHNIIIRSQIRIPTLIIMYLDFQKMGKYVALSSQSISSIHKNLCGFHKANNDRDADAAFIYSMMNSWEYTTTLAWPWQWQWVNRFQSAIYIDTKAYRQGVRYKWCVGNHQFGKSMGLIAIFFVSFSTSNLNLVS